MLPPKRTYEKVAVDEWINGTIDEITYDIKHMFKNGEGPAVKIKIALDGYKFGKQTPWMLFSYSKKSNIYKWFIEPLVQGATEYMEFDLDKIKGMRVKVMFENSGEYQNIFGIRALDKKVVPDVASNQAKESDLADVVGEDDAPPF